MPRTIVLAAALVLTLTTGVAMIAAAVLLQPAALITSAAGGEEIVTRFYAAVNDAMATGDTSGIDAVVAAHFIDREPMPGASTGRDGLAAYLVALHHADPAMRLAPEAVAAHDGLAVARVSIAGGPGTGARDGALIDQPPPWGTVDVFRLAGGQIVERRGHTAGLAIRGPLAEIALDLPAPVPSILTLSRVTIAPTARWTFTGDGPTVLLAESASLHVEVARVALQSLPTKDGVALTPDQPLVVPAAAYGAVTNLASEPARLLVVTFALPQVGGAAGNASPLPPGVAVRTLAGALASDMSIGPARLTLDRIALARDAELTLGVAEGPILVALEAGRLDLRSSTTVWFRRGADGVSQQMREATLASGDGALIRADGFTILGPASDEGATALILALEPTIDVTNGGG